MPCLKRVFSVAFVLAAFLTAPSLAATRARTTRAVPTGAVIEKVVFENVLPFERGLVLDRIGVKPGDILTTSTIERIAHQLQTLRVPRGFSYQEGSAPGRIVLAIGAGC